jgi:hypothetical protein
MVTRPFAAVTVTGKLAAAAAEPLALPDADADAEAVAELAVDDVPAPADVVLEDDEQAARAAVQAAAVPSTAASRRGLFMVSYFLPKRGRKARPFGAPPARRRGGRDGSPFPRGPISSGAP